MSRLAFVEEPVDLTADGEGSMPLSPTRSSSQARYASSYEVFDLSNDDNVSVEQSATAIESSVAGESRKAKRQKRKASAAGLSGAVADAVQPANTKAIASSTASICAHVASSSSTTLAGQESVSISGFLSRFLSTKRECAAVPEPEPLAYSSDIFLSGFSAGVAMGAQAEGSEDEHEHEEGTLIDESADLLDSCLEPTAVAINLFNLPYTAREDEVRKLLRRAGLKIKSITLGGEDRVKGLLPGMALVEVLLSQHSAATPASMVASLHGAEMGGRSVRAALSGEKKRLSLESGRYFDENMSCKCNNCGQVGHLAADCRNAALPTPCHLCAGSDHDPGDCPNLICFRCGDFGHHSRLCTMDAVVRLSKPQLCLFCGSSRHDHIGCTSYEALGEAEQMVGAFVRCMVCGAQGHAVCGPKACSSLGGGTSDLELFCPNCGDSGHCIDICKHAAVFLESEDNLAYCLGPKHDAFFKYPSLAKDLERFEGDPTRLYQRILRASNEAHLFPSLTSQRRNVFYQSKQRQPQSRHSVGGDMRGRPPAPAPANQHSNHHGSQSSGGAGGYVNYSHAQMQERRGYSSNGHHPQARQVQQQQHYAHDRYEQPSHAQDHRRQSNGHGHEDSARRHSYHGNGADFQDKMDNRRRRFS